MDPTSANVNDLGSYVTDEGTATNEVSQTTSTTSTKFNTVFSACEFQRPDSPGLVALNQLLEKWELNRAWVNGIRSALIEADVCDADGNATADTSAIQEYLEANQLDREPTNITIAEVQMYGQPPYSGMVDDPINAATGNFTDTVVDLPMPGIVREIALNRTYNSRNTSHQGLFGPGWSTAADAGLDIDEHEVRFVLPDGGAAVFRSDGEGGFHPDHRRKMWLERAEDGWMVSRQHETTSRFAEDGTLVSWTTSSSSVTIDRGETEITLSETHSGRWLRLTINLDDGLVTRADTSDDRTARYTYDDNGHLAVVDRPDGRLRYEIDDDGLVMSITDADGVLVCRNTYDRWGRVTTQVERHGRETSYEYGETGVFKVTANDGAPPNVMVHDARGRLTSMLDGLGNVARVAYDDNDNVTQVIDREGATTRFEHDSDGNMTRRIDPDGLEVSFRYDEHARPIEMMDRASQRWRLRYTDEGRVPSRIEQPGGGEVRVDLNDQDLPVEVVDADGVALGLRWSADGQIVGVLDAEGNETTFTYDAAGNLVGHRTPHGVLTEMECDAAGRLLRSFGPQGLQAWTYSDAGRLVAEQKLNGDSWHGVLGADGEIRSVTTGAGSVIEYSRDAIGDIRGITRDGVPAQQVETDPVGRVLATTDALGATVTRAYDAEGRVVAITDPSGRTLHREVDALGRTVQVTNSAGHTVHRTYHPNGELAAVVDAGGRRWQYEVDELGKCTAMVDPAGNITRYERTAAGRLVRCTSPLGRTVEYDYDRAGRVSVVRYADGSTTEYRYDTGRLETVHHHRTGGREEQVDFAYSDAGAIAGLSSSTGSVGFDYTGGELTGYSDRNASGQLPRSATGTIDTAIDPSGAETSFVHNSHGKVTETRTGAAATTFDHDAMDRVQQIVDPYGQATSLTRDERGLVVGVEYGDGSSLRHVFGVDGSLDALYDGEDDLLLGFDRDGSGRVTALRGPGGTTRYDLDVLARVSQVVNPTGEVRYGRDADGRVTEIREVGGLQVAVAYDDADGRVRYRFADRTVDAPAVGARQRDEHGRIRIDDDGRQYSYDTAGRLVSAHAGDDEYRFTYDVDGRLASESGPSGTVAYTYGSCGELLVRRDDQGETRYEYDARGRRIAEARPDGSQLEYRWDALGRLQGYSRMTGDGAASERRVQYATQSRPCRIDGVGILWDDGRSGDLLGVDDERLLWHGSHSLSAVDPESQWSRRLTDDPFGIDGATGVRVGYRGHLACDHLLFLGDRVYDPSTRQFLSRDPLASVPGRLDFSSLYSYCHHDPVNLVDPTGRRPVSDAEYDRLRMSPAERFAHDAVDFVKENWKEIAIVAGSVALGVVLTPVVGPIAAGAIAGAAGNAGITAVNGGSLGDIARSAAIGGITGAAGGALLSKAPIFTTGRLAPSTATNITTRAGENALRQGAAAVPTAVGGELLDSYTPGGDGEFNGDMVATNVLLSTAGGTVGDELTFRSTPPPSSSPDLAVPDSPAGYTRTDSGLHVPDQSGLYVPNQPELILPPNQLIVPGQPELILPGADQLILPSGVG